MQLNRTEGMNAEKEPSEFGAESFACSWSGFKGRQVSSGCGLSTPREQHGNGSVPCCSRGVDNPQPLDTCLPLKPDQEQAKDSAPNSDGSFSAFIPSVRFSCIQAIASSSL